MTEDLLVDVKAITHQYRLDRGLLGARRRLTVVDDVSLSVRRGQVIGVVGESGSGKSTLARIICGLIVPTGGDIVWNGTLTGSLSGEQRKAFRADVQMVFQDPYGTLDPTKTVGYTIVEPLVVHKRIARADRDGTAEQLLERVALDPSLRHRYPDQLSGGQRQRVAIARALALEPSLIVADEPTSALDLSTRAEILNLLLDIQAQQNISIVLISHDFATIRHMSHEIVVMHRGRIVESAPTARIDTNLCHPYTRRLLNSVPELHDAKRILEPDVLAGGSGIEISDPAVGCTYASRCPSARAECIASDPALVGIGDGHVVRCVDASTPDMPALRGVPDTGRTDHHIERQNIGDA